MGEGRGDSRVAAGVVSLAAILCSCLLARAQARWPGLAPTQVQAESPNLERARQEWFYLQRAYPRRHIPAGARLRALRQLRRLEQEQRENRALENQLFGKPSSAPTGRTNPTALFNLPSLSTTAWTLIGPQPTVWPSGSFFDFSPTSGRVTALAVDPANGNIIYLGSAEGGVWSTTDGGQHWTPLTDQQASLAVGSIAVDPKACTATGCSTIYVGTGESDFAFDNYYGAGILKSTDGGTSWTRISSPFVGPTGSVSPECGGATIGALAVDPANSAIVLAGVLSTLCVSASESGIFRSMDGGLTWTQVESGNAVNNLMFDSTGANAYAAMSVYFGFSANGIYKSTDSGQTWTAISNGLPSGTTAGRIALALAPSTSGSSAVLYAGVSDGSNDSATLLGVYKSTNGGGTWTRLSNAPDYCGPSGEGADQCFFDNVIAVAPNNPDVVALGGSETVSKAGYAGTIFLSTDGGTSFTDITKDGSGNGVHPDAHALAISADGSKLVAGTDGGAWSTPISSTGAGTWSNLNSTLALTQFYPGMSVDPTNPGSAFAGAQDNGSQEYSGQLAWDDIGCGDGAQTAFNYSDLNTLYVGCFYLPPNQNPDGTSADFLFRLTASPQTAAAADSGINGTDRGWPIPPLTMDPSNPNTLYFGTYRIYRTTDSGNSWTPISYDLTVGDTSLLDTISTIAVAPGDSDIVYVGTNDGEIWVTTQATQSSFPAWTPSGPGYGRSVTAIAVDPANPQAAYFTLSGFSGFPDCSGCTIDHTGHVFETTATAGSPWTDISGSLPNIPVNDIVVDPDIPNTLYIATDIGVFEGTNSGGTWTWTPLATGLPKVAVMSLKLQHASRVLSAASYGRSVWDLQLPAPAGPTAVLSSPILIFGAQEATTTSAAQKVILTNNSSSALSITSIASSVAYFTLASGTTCPASGGTLAAGQNCTISVEFAPTAPGALAGTVTVTDNAASGATQTISLKGTGFSGAVSLNPTSLSFGNQLVGTSSSAQTVTLTNTSTVSPLTITGVSAPGGFTETNDCVSASPIAAGTSCQINVTFSPSAMGQVAEQVTVTDSDPDSPQAIAVSGTGIAAVGRATPSSLNFASQAVGATSAPQTVTISNTGTAPLTFSAMGVAKKFAGTFAVAPSATTCSTSTQVAPGTSCTIGVTFTANVTFTFSGWGVAQGSLAVTSNALAPITDTYLAGSGYTGAAALAPSALSFGAVSVGQTSGPQTVTLTNSGSTPLYVGSVTVPTGAFAETDNCPRPASSTAQGAPLAPGASCTVNVTFSPTATGSQSATLALYDSAQGYSQSVSLTGTGGQPDYSLSVSGSSTASVAPGGTANYTFSVAPQGGFNQAVTLACAGAPSEATCTVSPASVTLDGTNAQNVKVTVTTTAASALPPAPIDLPPFGRWPVALWIAMLGLASLAAVYDRRLSGRRSGIAGYRPARQRLAPVAAILLFVALWASCGGGGSSGGGGGGNPGTPAGTYTLTVTGTSTSGSTTLKHDVNLTLTVM